MKAKDLIKILEQYPDAEVFHEDINFGNKAKEFEIYDIEYSDEHKCFMIEGFMQESLS